MPLSDDIPEIPPYPIKHCIALHPFLEVFSSAYDHETTHDKVENFGTILPANPIPDREPQPLSHAVDLFSIQDAYPSAFSECRPTPVRHEVVLSSFADVSRPIPDMDAGSQLMSIPLDLQFPPLSSTTSGKHIHFANDNDAFPVTPSPTFSSVSLASSGSPQTSFSATGSNLTGHVVARIHPVLAITRPTPMVRYDVSYPPSTMTNIPPNVFNEPATSPPVPSMIISCPHLPWTIKILPTNTKYVTVRDVFDGIYSSLRHTVLESEFRGLPSDKARNSVNNAYIHRYKRIDGSEARHLEKSKGLKRVDFLSEGMIFLGLSSTKSPDVWLLNLSSSWSTLHIPVGKTHPNSSTTPTYHTAIQQTTDLLEIPAGRTISKGYTYASRAS